MKALPVYLQWLILLGCLLALGFILQHYHVPAALLLGPMMVGLVMALSGARIRHIAKSIYRLPGHPGVHDSRRPLAFHSVGAGQ